MNLSSLLISVVLAAESIISPLGDGSVLGVTNESFPRISFQEITARVNQTVADGVKNSGLGRLTSLIAGTGTISATIIPGQVALVQTRTTKKPIMTIAAIGDSMIDTLGPDLPHLRDALKNVYPDTTFTMLNYGVGGTNIDYGLERLLKDYTYEGKQFPALVSTNPDLVIVESFAYNPYSYDTGALTQHWLSLAFMIDTLRANVPTAKIAIAATIAPDKNTFGDGAPGLSYNPEDKYKKTRIFHSYLENTIRFAQSQRLPLADVYHASMDSTGNGRAIYINPGDHIHYSDEGRRLFAAKVTETIVENRLLE